MITVRNLRIHRAAERQEPARSAWSLQKSLALLGVATLATAFVSEILVHSLDHFGKAVGLDEFFIAVVIVAIVGNAAEHGGAIVIAHRGNTTLATEIAVTSSMQVALFVAPAVVPALVARRPRPAALVPRWSRSSPWRPPRRSRRWSIWDGRSRRWEGFLLVGVYARSPWSSAYACRRVR